MSVDDDTPSPYDTVTTHRRRARRLGLASGLGTVLVVHGVILSVQAEAELFHLWPDPGLILQVGIAGGTLLVCGILGWFRTRKLDDRNYMVQKTTPMPLRLVGEFDDVWIEGKICCPRPVKPPVLSQRCAWYHYIEEARDGDGDWEKVREQTRQARTWLLQGDDAIRLDLRRATFEFFHELTQKRGSRRHRLRYLRTVGRASASGVATRPENRAGLAKKTRLAAAGGKAGEDGGAGNPFDLFPGVGRGLRERLMARSRRKKETRARKVSIRPPKNSAAWKRSKARETGEDEDRSTPGEGEPVAKWLLAPCQDVALMVTPLDRARWYDRTEANEVTWGTASLVVLFVAISSGIWTLGVISDVMALDSVPGLAISIILGLGLLLPILAVSTYNRFVTMRMRVRNAWAHIDVDLAARHDLVPNMVEAVKGIAGHERTVFESVASSRSTGEGLTSAVAREVEMDRVARRLLALEENYPDLKASMAYARLAKELTALEEKIAFGRVFYNDTVREYSTLIEVLPNVLFSGILGFHRLPSWGDVEG